MALLGSNNGSSPIGSILASMLTEAEFQAKYGITWVLSDGRSCVGTKFGTLTSSAVLPNLCGVFLRGKNAGSLGPGRDASTGNTDGDSLLGTYQADNNTPHDHSASQGNHSHTVPGVFTSSVSEGNASLKGNAEASTFTKGTTSVSAGAITIGSTGAEGRSRNITVNYFIRIN